jgi:hypothetical protein
LKRGFDRKDMNVGFLKAKQLILEEKLKEWRKGTDDRIKRWIKRVRYTPVQKQNRIESPVEEEEEEEVEEEQPVSRSIFTSLSVLTVTAVVSYGVYTYVYPRYKDQIDQFFAPKK